jgi:16S rRNA (cytosine967-C5)-methyltransferase
VERDELVVPGAPHVEGVARVSLRSSGAPTARSVAAKVLVRIDQDGAFAAAALDAELARAVQLEPRDRALATELVYGALRVRPWLDERIGRRTKKGNGVRGLEPRTRAHLEVAAYQLFFLERVPAFAAVNEAVNGVRAATGPKVAAFANAVLRGLATEASAERVEPAVAVVASAAPWLVESLGRALGESEVSPYLASGAGAAPLGIRVARAEERDEWIAKLRAAVPSASFEPGRVSPLAILVRGAGRPQDLPGWADGAWAIQEEGSQLIGLALGAKPGDVVLDACAGRGNKTALLASLVGAQGAVDAADLYPAKLEALARDLARGHVAPRACYAVDWSKGAGDVPAGYDRVLVDAPCSGVGTLRRRPDLQTRRSPENLASLADLQRGIVVRAADRVRPGGRLVYAVCSVLREEAEDVVASLLAARPDFAPVPFESPPAQALVQAPVGADAGAPAPTTLRLLPHVHGTDGYFVASLGRK